MRSYSLSRPLSTPENAVYIFSLTAIFCHLIHGLKSRTIKGSPPWPTHATPKFSSSVLALLAIPPPSMQVVPC
jgi:hypothetical protein